MKSDLATHMHTGGGLGFVQVGPDPILASSMLSKIPKNLQKITDNVSRALNFQVMKVNYLGLPNAEEAKNRLKTRKSILSRHVFTT